MLRLGTAVLCCLSLCSFLQAADDAAAAQDAADALFAEFPTVEAASLHTQSLLDAPASVTVISAEELQLFGYRTIGEALANVRGFYVSNDGLYSYLGLRGLSLPGDYSTRFLVMINGHYMTDNVYSSNGLLGQDFPLDWDLIQRIEVIRGPSSAIYGSNGVFATVNVVTRAPVDLDAVTLSTEVDTRGAAKQHFSTSQYLGRGVNLLLSGSGFFDGGSDRLMDGVGVARDVGEEMGGHAFLHVTWKDWSVTAMGGQRAALVPTGAYGVVFNDRGNRATDARGFAELKYSKHFDSTRELRWRVYYDNYRYRATYRYDLDDELIEDNRDLTQGDWLGTRLTYSWQNRQIGQLTAGLEANLDLRAYQSNFDLQPEPYVYFSGDRKNSGYGLFLQQEVRLSNRTTAYVGGRYDDARLDEQFFSPRLALIHQPGRESAVKLLYGKSFRSPNAYEEALEIEGFNIPNPLLKPETAHTVEAVYERRLSRRVTLTASGYHYWFHDLIEGTADQDNVIQFQNGDAVSVTGVEMEVSRQLDSGFGFAASTALQKLDSSTDSLTRVNSPRALAKFRLSTPVLFRFARAAVASRIVGPRHTYSGTELPTAAVFDLTLTTNRLVGGLRLTAGVRNALNTALLDPVGPEQLTDQMPQRRRSFFIKATWATAR